MTTASNNPILRYDAGKLFEQGDELAQEEPLEIRVGGRAVSVTMRTPGHDDELAAGFLLTEGIVSRPQDVARIDQSANIADVILGPGVILDFERLTRHVFASSSCGLCGKATIETIRTQFKPITSSMILDVGTLLEMPIKMREAQATF